MAAEQCAQCGRPLDSHSHERHIRFGLPEPVRELSDRERTTGTWLSGPTAYESVFMSTPGTGAFVRCLLPVRLDDGQRVVFGVWVAVGPDDWRRIPRVWFKRRYRKLRFDGVLANPLPGWDVFGRSVSAAVRDPDETPYCVASPDVLLQRVLTEQWPAGPVLAALGLAGDDD